MVEHHVDVVGSHTHLDGGAAARRECRSAVDVTRKALEAEVGTAFPSPIAGAFHHNREGTVVVGGVVGLHHNDRNALTVLRKGNRGLPLTACGVLVGCNGNRPDMFHTVAFNSHPWLVGTDAPRRSGGVDAAEEQLAAAAVAGEGEQCVADMEAIVRHSTEQCLVALIEMVDGAYLPCRADVGANVVDGVVAVTVAAPTEVEMEEDLSVAVLIAVAHKAVSAFGSHTAIDNGVLQTQLGNETVGPPLVGVSIGSVYGAHFATIVEVVFKRVVDTGCTRMAHQSCGTAASLGIAHVEAYAYMVHQGRDG